MRIDISSSTIKHNIHTTIYDLEKPENKLFIDESYDRFICIVKHKKHLLLIKELNSNTKLMYEKLDPEIHKIMNKS